LNQIFIDANLFIDYIREKTRDFAFVWHTCNYSDSPLRDISYTLRFDRLLLRLLRVHRLMRCLYMYSLVFRKNASY